ncbi:MAG TPA: response regulator [Gemmiger formicilis]|nr:response regulator [Gemmiger formicilis]
MTRVLLVDDEPLVLIGMQGMLNWAALGYEVVGTARNGAEALRAVQEKQPDIVVSDIRMPVMDGFALAEACHKDGSALPAFIMLTSYEEFDYVKRSMRLGVVDYLVKIDLTADSLTAGHFMALTLMKRRSASTPSETGCFCSCTAGCSRIAPCLTGSVPSWASPSKRRGILWRWAACKRPTCPQASL